MENFIDAVCHFALHNPATISHAMVSGIIADGAMQFARSDFQVVITARMRVFQSRTQFPTKIFRVGCAHPSIPHITATRMPVNPMSIKPKLMVMRFSSN